MSYSMEDIRSGVQALSLTKRRDGETAFPDLPTIDAAVRHVKRERETREAAARRDAEYAALVADKAAHPEKYIGFGDLMADVMERRGVKRAEEREQQAEESTAECPHCGGVLILQGASLTTLEPEHLEALAAAIRKSRGLLAVSA